MKTNVYKNGQLELCCEFRRLTLNDSAVIEEIITKANLISFHKNNYQEMLENDDYYMFGMFDINGLFLASGAVELNCSMEYINLENKMNQHDIAYLGAGYVPEKFRKSGYASIIADYLLSLNLSNEFSVGIIGRKENYSIIKDELASQVNMFEDKGFINIGYVPFTGLYYVAQASELKIKRKFIKLE